MNLRTRLLVVSTLALLAAGCAAPLPEPHQSVVARDPDQVRGPAILEVYRQATAGRSDGPDLCVGVEPGVDVSKVLKAVSGRGPRIWAVDRCTFREGRIVEALSGRPAIRVSVESVEIADSGGLTPKPDECMERWLGRAASLCWSSASAPGPSWHRNQPGSG
jgi:hypothetical protein